jgi:hypothetical protein
LARRSCTRERKRWGASSVAGLRRRTNSLAVGKLIEALGNSKYWANDRQIFILEDDAQGGPDHVDAHRSIAFVVSPYAEAEERSNSTPYTTSEGCCERWRLILAVLPPLSQYDAAAA